MEFNGTCRSNDRDVWSMCERKEKRALIALVLTKAFPFIERIKLVLRAMCQDLFL